MYSPLNAVSFFTSKKAGAVFTSSIRKSCSSSSYGLISRSFPIAEAVAVPRDLAQVLAVVDEQLLRRQGREVLRHVETGEGHAIRRDPTPARSLLEVLSKSHRQGLLGLPHVDEIVVQVELVDTGALQQLLDPHVTQGGPGQLGEIRRELIAECLRVKVRWNVDSSGPLLSPSWPPWPSSCFCRCGAYDLTRVSAAHGSQ